MADLGGAAMLRAAEVSGLLERLAPQFHANMDDGEGSVMVSLRYPIVVAKLWDSQDQFSNVRESRTGLFTWSNTNLNGTAM